MVLKLGGMGQETYIVKTYFPAIFVEITGKKIHYFFYKNHIFKNVEAEIFPQI